MATPHSVHLVLFVLCSYDSLINALTIKTSIDHQYENKTIDCNPLEPCVVICQNLHSCRRSTIHCPIGYPCDVICNSSYTCAESIVHAKDASFFQLLDCATGTWTCIGITIYFPTNNQGVPLSKLIGADLGLSAGLEAAYPLEFYAVDGWNDMNITPIDYFSFAGDLNVGTMHCLKDYSVSCNFSLTAWSCENPDDFCNDPYTLSPTITTINPSKTPTLPPSTTPSKSPTQPPSMHPSTTTSPSVAPTAPPTQPSMTPTSAPTLSSSMNPSKYPTINPTKMTNDPSLNPSDHPTMNPSKYPTINPTNIPSQTPTKHPTITPTTRVPTEYPTTANPAKYPTNNPTKYPTTLTPTVSTKHLTVRPAIFPTIADIISTFDEDSKSPSARLKQIDPQFLYYGIIVLCSLSIFCIIIMVCCCCKMKKKKNKLAPPDPATVQMSTDGVTGFPTGVTQTETAQEDSDESSSTKDAPHATQPPLDDKAAGDDEEEEILTVNPHHFQSPVTSQQYTLPFSSNFEPKDTQFPHVAHYDGTSNQSEDSQLDGYQANLYKNKPQSPNQLQVNKEVRASNASSMYYNANVEEKQSRVAEQGVYLGGDANNTINTWPHSQPPPQPQQQFGGYQNNNPYNQAQGFGGYQNVPQQYQGQGQFYGGYQHNVPVQQYPGGYQQNIQPHEQRQFVRNMPMDVVDEKRSMKH